MVCCILTNLPRGICGQIVEGKPMQGPVPRAIHHLKKIGLLLDSTAYPSSFFYWGRRLSQGNHPVAVGLPLRADVRKRVCFANGHVPPDANCVSMENQTLPACVVLGRSTF